MTFLPSHQTRIICNGYLEYQHHGEAIIITPENLIKATNAIRVNLTDREKPVS
jgi:hypothetical protein